MIGFASAAIAALGLIFAFDARAQEQQALDLAAQSTMRIGDKAARKAAGLDTNKYTIMIRADMSKVERGLSAMCPCLLIHVDKAGKGVEVLDPRMSESFTAVQKTLFPKKDVTKAAEKFCACYAKSRIGCNIVWAASHSKKPITIWRSKTSEEKGFENDGDSLFKPGHLAWNTATPRGPEIEGATLPETPAIWALAHEMGHAYFWISSGYKTNNSKKGDKEWLDDEYATVRAENQVRAELRLHPDYKKHARALAPRIAYQFDGERHEVTNPSDQEIKPLDLLKCGDQPKAVVEDQDDAEKKKKGDGEKKKEKKKRVEKPPVKKRLRRVERDRPRPQQPDIGPIIELGIGIGMQRLHRGRERHHGGGHLRFEAR